MRPALAGIAGLAAAGLLAACGNSAPVAPGAGATALLSADTSLPNIGSSYGSGGFGQWQQDDAHLPGYLYTIDEDHDPRAQQPELLGKTQANLQLGNDRAKAFAFNHGYTQFWSQDRSYQWANLYDAHSQHWAGGYGYLRTAAGIVSTQYEDRPAGAVTRRYFGTGYYGKQTSAQGFTIAENVYAPWGDDPILLHDVSITNDSGTTQTVSWFEYWDVNPVAESFLNYNFTAPAQGNTVPGFVQGNNPLSVQTLADQRGFGAATYDAANHALAVKQLPYLTDLDPLSIYAADLIGPDGGHETSLSSFFGSGGRAAPAEVAADALSGTLTGVTAPLLPGKTLFAFRAPLTLAPGQTVTLRYAYGMAHAAVVPGLLAKYRDGDPYNAMRQAWLAFLPRADFGAGREWMNRELMWTAYTMRSGFTYEEVLGHHNLSQSGYYQYEEGLNAGFRSWMHYVLPMMQMDPAMTREIFRYSLHAQPNILLDYQEPYSFIGMGVRFDLGIADDQDFWLLNAAPEYAFATRDLGFFNEQIPFYDGGTASAWEHIKLAFGHQESWRKLGPHGLPLVLPTGDWSDLSSVFLQMTESNDVLAQTAFAYPRLAELADLLGDGAFAAQVRAAEAEIMPKLQSQWITGRGWYSRGYALTRQLGTGAMFLEPQPWALLAGAASPAQAQRLVDNYRRFLLGQNAPAQIHGPDKIGASQSPASNDPDVTERSEPAAGVGNNNAVFVGGAWYDLNGHMTWALSELDGAVADAQNLAFDEYQRNSLGNHATAYPDHWTGVISSDDVCYSYYATHPDYCGAGSTANFNGWNMEQPTWYVMNALNLAGLRATPTGYRIAPHFPFDTYSFRYPQVGIAAQPGLLRGYFRPQASGPIQMQVRLPAGVTPAAAYENGRPVASTVTGGEVSFTLDGQAQQAVDWAVSW